MSFYQAYQRQQALGWTRVDMLLSLYDRTIDRLEQALAVLRSSNGPEAGALLAQCRLLVAGLIAGVNPAAGDVAINFQRLYDFVLYSLDNGSVDKLEGALQVLQTVRDGFQERRAEAVRLEREGSFPPADASPALQALA